MVIPWLCMVSVVCVCVCDVKLIVILVVYVFFILFIIAFETRSSIKMTINCRVLHDNVMWVPTWYRIKEINKLLLIFYSFYFYFFLLKFERKITYPSVGLKVGWMKWVIFHRLICRTKKFFFSCLSLRNKIIFFFKFHLNAGRW